MKRIICICLIICIAVFAAGCGAAEEEKPTTVTVVTDSGTTINIERADLNIVKCLCSVNDGEKTAVEGDDAAALFDRAYELSDQRIDEGNKGENSLALTFITNQGYCGYYVFYDNGVFSFADSPKTETVAWYSYDSAEYAALTELAGE